MKALNLYGKQDIRFESSPEPIVNNPDDVIIKVKASGICGSDISRYNKLGPYSKGMTFGHEFSGEVVEVGSNVNQFKAGNRVTGCPTFYCGECYYCTIGELSRCDNLTLIGARSPGAYAEYVKLPASHVLSLPDTISYDEAALVEPSSVVVHGFYRTKIQPGDTVAVMGCGNIGLLAIQWAKIFGAKKVIAIDIDQVKLEKAKEVGADECIDSLETPAHKQLMEYTNGLGVNVAIEAAGSPVTSAQVLALPRKGGQVIYMGIPYADINIDRFYFEKIVRNELAVYGSFNAISAPFPGKEWDATLHYMSTGQLDGKPLISHRLGLEEGPKAFADIIKRKEKYAKVLFYPEI